MGIHRGHSFRLAPRNCLGLTMPGEFLERLTNSPLKTTQNDSKCLWSRFIPRARNADATPDVRATALEQLTAHNCLEWCL